MRERERDCLLFVKCFGNSVLSFVLIKHIELKSIKLRDRERERERDINTL